MLKTIQIIPLSARLLIIVQLCVGLSCLLWLLFYPFMGGYFKIQSEILLIEAVMGKDEALKRIDLTKSEQLAEITRYRKQLFEMQEQKTKDWLQKEEAVRKNQLQNPLSAQIMAAGGLLLSIPRLELIWIILTVLTPIALLLRKAWALKVVWLLPLLAIGYSWNNATYGLNPLQASDRGLFPSEAQLNLSSNSREDLEASWHRYLITTWAHEEPAQDAAQLQQQIIKGEYNFTLERIHRLPHSLNTPFWEQKSLLTLSLYCLWNLFFALFIYRQLSAHHLKEAR